MTRCRANRLIISLSSLLAVSAMLAAQEATRAVQATTAPLRIGHFVISYDNEGVTGIAATHDPFAAPLLAPGGRLGVMLKYRVPNGDWLDLFQNEPALQALAPGTLAYTNDVRGTVLKSIQTFHTDGRVLDWTVDVANRVEYPVDDTDGFDYWWGYVVAADDPVLGKAPFLASKNLRFPDAQQIKALEYARPPPSSARPPLSSARPPLSFSRPPPSSTQTPLLVSVEPGIFPLLPALPALSEVEGSLPKGSQSKADPVRGEPQRSRITHDEVCASGSASQSGLGSRPRSCLPGRR